MMHSAPVPKRHETLRWTGDADGHLILIDQTRLPVELVEQDCRDVESVWEAVRSLRVRGAPAIGIAAAYGVCLGLQTVAGDNTQDLFTRLEEVTDYLAGCRPTAVNLSWALDRMRRRALAVRDTQDPREIRSALLTEAQTIHEEDRQICRAIGHHGASLLADDMGVLTHCNAGGLATSEYGTALSVLFTAHENGRKVHVFVDETRPLLQGARLTAWELTQRGIPSTLICDSMAAQVMREGRVHAVITGADRVAANGDTANKIGTYSVAVLAQAHQIPFYIAAPTSTFDLSIDRGDDIPIEQRPAEEITHGFGRRTAPEDVDVYNPAFDVTPASLIKAIITERGIIEPVSREQVKKVVGQPPRGTDRSVP
jgi:methylthioribose-1-phosphate isomerase